MQPTVPSNMDPNQNPNPDLEVRFTFHPASPAQAEVYEAARGKAKELAYFFDQNAPHSRELSLALTNLEQAVFWFNAAVARNT